MSTRHAAKSRTREVVLQSAEHCFRTRGFVATTVREIAENAGVSVGSVMAVGDKQALLIAVFDREIGELHRGARSAAPAASTAGIADELLALVDPFLELFSADPALSQHYAATLVAGAHESAVFTELAEALMQEFATALERLGDTSENAAAQARALYYVYLGVLFAGSARAGRDTRPAALREALRGELRAAFVALDRERVAS